MMPVKADLAICSSLIGVSESVAFMPSHYWDISSCRIVPGFCKLVTNYSSANVAIIEL